MSLTPRQAKFVEAYALDRNAARAARTAGYSQHKPSSRAIAVRLLADVSVRAALAVKEAELAATLEIDRTAIIGGIFQAIAQARTQGEPSQVIRGWVEVARITGLDKPDAAPRVPISAAGAALKQKLESMSDADLFEISQGRQPAR
jgi:phage terminase small subunit